MLSFPEDGKRSLAVRLASGRMPEFTRVFIFTGGSAMTPFLAAAAVYDREPCARSFEADLFLHLVHGVVVSTPDVFAMVRPVWSTWGIERLRTPSETAADGDCWWIWLAAGNVGSLFAWPLPVRVWVGFERENIPKLIRFRDVRRLFRTTKRN